MKTITIILKAMTLPLLVSLSLFIFSACFDDLESQLCAKETQKSNKPLIKRGTIQMDIQKVQKNLIVCTLSGPELIQRKQELQKKIFKNIQSIKELDNGYAFIFEYSEGLDITIADYLLAESKCCPFFKTTFILYPNKEGLEFNLTGSREVKATLTNMLQGLQLI